MLLVGRIRSISQELKDIIDEVDAEVELHSLSVTEFKDFCESYYDYIAQMPNLAEKTALIGYLNVTISSYEFWSSENLNSFNEIYEQAIGITEPQSHTTFRDVVKADGWGFLTGAVRGGMGTAYLGPWGVFAGALAGGGIGAGVASLGSALNSHI